MNTMQMSALGELGRWGNQLIQYCFARAYAEKYGAILEVPNWIGTEVFDLNDAPISDPLPRTKSDAIPWGKTNIDLFGFFQNSECLAILSKRKFRSYLPFKKQWLEMFPKTGPYIAAHLRRGDYLSTYSYKYCIVSEKSYFDACRKFGLNTDNLVIVSEETQSPGVENPCRWHFCRTFQAHARRCLAAGQLDVQLDDWSAGRCDGLFAFGGRPGRDERR